MIVWLCAFPGCFISSVVHVPIGHCIPYSYSSNCCVYGSHTYVEQLCSPQGSYDYLDHLFGLPAIHPISVWCPRYLCDISLSSSTSQHFWMSQRSRHSGLSKAILRHGFRHGQQRQTKILHAGKQAERRAAQIQERRSAIQGTRCCQGAPLLTLWIP